MASRSSTRIAVLGAGITGLVAAFRLAQRGHRVRLFEAAARVGGTIRTERIDGWLIECGPNALLADPALLRLLDELRIDGAKIEAHPNGRRRFIVRDGRLVDVPFSPAALLKSPLFTARAKLRIASEWCATRRIRTTDLCVATFMRAHFGAEFVDRALDAFVAGVYAGDPNKLSTRHAFPKLWELEQSHGSLLRAQRAGAKKGPPPAPISFRHGLSTLPEALAAQLPPGALSLGARIEALMPGAEWNVVWTDGTTTHTETFDAVISALPGPALAQLRFGMLGERPLASLDAIEHPPVASVFLGYSRGQVRHPLDGFGAWVPSGERRAVLSLAFPTATFPGRAPDNHVAINAVVGGTRQPELARLPTAQLLPRIATDLKELLGVEGAPVFQRVSFWPRAIPQYTLGYDVHLEAMTAAERAHPRLFIGGQVRDGIAVSACIAAGERLAARAE